MSIVRLCGLGLVFLLVFLTEASNTRGGGFSNKFAASNASNMPAEGPTATSCIVEGWDPPW